MSSKSDRKKKYMCIFQVAWWKWLLKKIIVIMVIVVFGAIGFLLAPRPYYKTGFRNLTELKQYVATKDEFIKMENKNLLMPSYENYYKKNFSYTFAHKIRETCRFVLSKFGVMDKPLFSASFFKTILEDVTKVRLRKGWTGEFVQKFQTTPASKILVFGVVQGALHGLVRYLDKLKDLGIINEQLKVMNPDYFLVFLGNVVNRSPYTLEIFSIVLRLMQENPDNVIYLKNSNEFPDYWRGQTLRRELEIRAHHVSKQMIPLEKEVDTFFDTLPMNVYGTIPYVQYDKTPYFRLSSYTGDREKSDEATFASFLLEKNRQRLDAFDLKKAASTPQKEYEKIELRAVVKDIFKREEYEEMDGLRLLDFQDNVASWTVLSASSESYRAALNFFYDAFVVIDSAHELRDWTITLYKRGIQELSKDFETRFNYFFSGE
ncbi:MAG: hypothetical protein V1855_02640 [bacterium]